MASAILQYDCNMADMRFYTKILAKYSMQLSHQFSATLVTKYKTDDKIIYSPYLIRENNDDKKTNPD